MSHRMAVYTRQDITIVDAGRLVAEARRLGAVDQELDEESTAVAAALRVLLIEYGVDEVGERAGEWGMRAGRSVTVTAPGDGPAGVWPEAFREAGPAPTGSTPARRWGRVGRSPVPPDHR